MYSSKNIYNITKIVHDCFDNKIACCGGLADFFHIENDKKFIKDFDFYITISDLIKSIKLSSDVIRNLLDKKQQVIIEIKDLKLRKYSPFLPNHICCLQGYLKIGNILYFIDIFVVEDTDYKPHQEYLIDDKIFNIETPESRINTLKYHLSLHENNYIPNRPGASVWLKDKKEKFKLKLKRYEAKYNEKEENAS
jgi:hypothetical protein